MIEIIIKQYLDDQFFVPVFLEKKGKMPEKYVLIEKTSGTKRNHLLSSTVAFQSYAESKYEAALLNEQVKESVESMIILNEISGIKLNSDYPFTDTETKQYRYQALFDINHY